MRFDDWSPYALTTVRGELWATVLEPAGLARVDVGTSTLESWDFPARPLLPAAAPDGAVWCTRADDRLVRCGPDGTVGEVALPAGCAPYGIGHGPDGSVWFTAPGRNALGRLHPGGEVELIDLPVPRASPAMLTVTADGAVWAALNAAGALLRRHDGEFSLVPLPPGRAAPAPVGIAAAGDDVWYTDIAGGSTGLATAAGAVEPVEFPDPACRPHAVAAETDGGCWVTLWGSGELARVFPGGRTELHALPGREPHGLTLAGAHVWVAMESGSLESVGRAVG